METLSWITLVGPECYYKCLYKRVTRGVTVREGAVTTKEAEIGVTHFKDGGRGQNPRQHRVRVT